jgi:hypothetical protein
VARSAAASRSLNRRPAATCNDSHHHGPPRGDEYIFASDGVLTVATGGANENALRSIEH